VGGGERVILKSSRDCDCWGGTGSLDSGTLEGAGVDEPPLTTAPVVEGTERGGTELGLVLSGFLSNMRSRAVSHFIKVGRATLQEIRRKKMHVNQSH